MRLHSQLCEWSRQRNVGGFRVDSWFGGIILNKLFKCLRASHESESAVGAVAMWMNSGRTKCTTVTLWSLPELSLWKELSHTFVLVDHLLSVLNMRTLCSFNDVEKRFLIPSEAVPCIEQPEF